MVCTLTCFISILFVVANIFMMLSVNCKNTKMSLQKILDPKQLLIHEKIVMERRNIYFKGYILGIVLSILLIVVNKSVLAKKMKNWSMICTVGAVTFTTNYLYYILSPKTTYMIQHLDNKQQINAWLKIYRTMQVKYHTGLVLGIVAIMIFAHANRC